MMGRLSLSRAWDESRQIFTRDGSLISAVALALLVLPQIIAGLIAPEGESAPSVATRLIVLVAAFIALIGQLAIVRLAIGPSTSVGEAIRHGLRRFPAMFGALLIMAVGLIVILVPLMAILFTLGIVDMPTNEEQPGAAFGILALLLVIACVLIAVKFMLSVPVASAERDGPFGILKRSWRLSNGHYFPLLGFELLLLVMALALLLAAQEIGGIVARLVAGDATPLSLGALIVAIAVASAQALFTVIASVMLARVYVQLAGKGETSVPNNGI